MGRGDYIKGGNFGVMHMLTILDCDDNFKGIYICQNLTKYTF